VSFRLRFLAVTTIIPRPAGPISYVFRFSWFQVSYLPVLNGSKLTGFKTTK
jgi:hypothetical protein